MSAGEIYTAVTAPSYGVRALTKAEYAHEWIRERILSGEFQPGMALDPEALSSRLGVSTTPLREAVRRLETEQLVSTAAHRHVYVAPLEYETLAEVFVVRLETEPLASRLATAAASDSELQAIAELVDNPPAADDALTLLRYNGAIHRQIYRASHNTVLIRVLDQLSDLVDRYRALAFRRDPGVSTAHRNHSEIIAALIARDGDLASRLMRDHVSYGFERMRKQEGA
ncbi:GntR family transcriptional regulator [Pseudonocardia xishanensis]|uniref:GntR family transcriptional regulator n=1 Tax=Pseudonocardia xishanensis TaxID=630995 RepID=A0ABP8RUF6_9PSEU